MASRFILIIAFATFYLTFTEASFPKKKIVVHQVNVNPILGPAKEFRSRLVWKKVCKPEWRKVWVSDWEPTGPSSQAPNIDPYELQGGGGGGGGHGGYSGVDEQYSTISGSSPDTEWDPAGLMWDTSGPASQYGPPNKGWKQSGGSGGRSQQWDRSAPSNNS